MSNNDIKQKIKEVRFRLEMGAKLTELAEAVADYYCSESSDTTLPGIKLAKSYGFRTEIKEVEEIKVYEEIVRNLAILSIQNMNLLRFHKDAPKFFEDLMFDYSNVRKAPIDSKFLVYIKSRILWNSQTYNLDENYFPKDLCTYNEQILEAFKRADMTYVIFDTIKDLADAPSKKIVKDVQTYDKTFVGNALVCSSSYIKKYYDWILSQRKIVLLYNS